VCIHGLPWESKVEHVTLHKPMDILKQHDVQSMIQHGVLGAMLHSNKKLKKSAHERVPSGIGAVDQVKLIDVKKTI
jgi:hypothetical protein